MSCICNRYSHRKEVFIMHNKFLRALLVFMLSLFLFACSGANPLDVPDRKTTAENLLSASRYAEKTLKLGEPPYRGYFYEACMKGKKKGRNCRKVYRVMLSKLRAQHIYRRLSLLQLTDKKMWLHIRDAYFNERFNQA